MTGRLGSTQPRTGTRTNTKPEEATGGSLPQVAALQRPARPVEPDDASHPEAKVRPAETSVHRKQPSPPAGSSNQSISSRFGANGVIGHNVTSLSSLYRQIYPGERQRQTLPQLPYTP